MNFETHMNELALIDADAFRSLAKRLRAMPELQPSPDLADRILAAVESERRGSGSPSRRRFLSPSPWWGIAAAAAALVAAAVAIYTVLPSCGARSLASVSEGLAWLADNQEADGTWSPSRHGGAEVYRPALTALSALALDRSEKSGMSARVNRACAALGGMQSADGAFGGNGRACFYNQAITTYALATLYPKHPELRPVLERSLSFVAARQTAQGGWDYESDSEGNAALTSWQVRALACADEQGFASAKVPLRKGLRWLRDRARDDGSIAYHRDSIKSSEGLNALAAYALITAGRNFPGLPELGRRVAGALCADLSASSNADCYRDYAKVKVFDSLGQSARADALRLRMRLQQKAAQQDQWGVVGGKLYTTAFTALAAR